jgi:hypothetical protein
LPSRRNTTKKLFGAPFHSFASFANAPTSGARTIAFQLRHKFARSISISPSRTRQRRPSPKAAAAVKAPPADDAAITIRPKKM